MSTIALIACSKKKDKNPEPMFVVNRYTGDLFKKSFAYAKTFTDEDHIFILSAKHHLLTLYSHIHDYDETLNDMNRERRREWSSTVFVQIQGMRHRWDPYDLTFVLLAGEKYVEFLEEPLRSIGEVERPLKGLGIGQQLKFLKEAVA
jgi:hypothetical protein